jgi:hypothetical protein
VGRPPWREDGSVFCQSLNSAGLGPSLHSLVADPTENTASNSPSIVMGCCLAIARISFPRERVYLAVAQKRPFICLLHSNGWTCCLLRGLCLATGLYAAIFRGKFSLVFHSKNASEYLRAIRRFRNTNLIICSDVSSLYICSSFFCYVTSNDDLCGTRSLLVTYIMLLVSNFLWS